MKKSSVRDRMVYSWQMVVMVSVFLYLGWNWCEVSGAVVGRVGVEDVRGVHDEDRAAEKLVCTNAC